MFSPVSSLSAKLVSTPTLTSERPSRKPTHTHTHTNTPHPPMHVRTHTHTHEHTHIHTNTQRLCSSKATLPMVSLCHRTFQTSYVYQDKPNPQSRTGLCAYNCYLSIALSQFISEKTSSPTTAVGFSANSVSRQNGRSYFHLPFDLPKCFLTMVTTADTQVHSVCVSEGWMSLQVTTKCFTCQSHQASGLSTSLPVAL